MQTEKVKFFSQGIAISGIYYSPEVAGPHCPTMVICGGLGAIKEMIAPDIAGHLAHRGYPVLTFDYRGFGESEGSRFRLIPSEQVADVRSAVSFLRTRDREAKIVLYGNSFGAGVALEAAAKDDRVSGMVGVVGVFDGAAWLRSLRTSWEWEEFLDAVERDRLVRVSEGSGEWVQPNEIMPADPEARKWAADVLERFPQRAYRLPLETAAEIIEWRPIDVAKRLAPRPVLIISAECDVLVPPQQSTQLFLRARRPKKLVLLRNAKHHDATGGPRLTEVLGEVEDWLSMHFGTKESDHPRGIE